MRAQTIETKLLYGAFYAATAIMIIGKIVFSLGVLLGTIL